MAKKSKKPPPPPPPPPKPVHERGAEYQAEKLTGARAQRGNNNNSWQPKQQQLAA